MFQVGDYVEYVGNKSMLNFLPYNTKMLGVKSTILEIDGGIVVLNYTLNGVDLYKAKEEV